MKLLKTYAERTAHLGSFRDYQLDVRRHSRQL